MTRLFFVEANQIMGTDDLGVILLADKDTKRGISIVCELAVVNQLLLRKSRETDTKRRLPEVLWTTIKRNTEGEYRILFSNMQEEQYVVFLYDELHSSAQAIRASDGVLLAMVADIPIFIDDKLFLRQSVVLDHHAKGIRVPLNSLSTSMLKDALSRAIEEEQFEHASYIRDELQRRVQTDDDNVAEEGKKDADTLP